jgi:hypothetical protein
MIKKLYFMLALACIHVFGQTENPSPTELQLPNGNFESVVLNIQNQFESFGSWQGTYRDTTFVAQVSAAYPVSGHAVGLKTSYVPVYGQAQCLEISKVNGRCLRYAAAPITGYNAVKDNITQTLTAPASYPLGLRGVVDFSSTESGSNAIIQVSGQYDNYIIGGFSTIPTGTRMVFDLGITYTPCTGFKCQTGRNITILVLSCTGCPTPSAKAKTYLILDELKFYGTYATVTDFNDVTVDNKIDFYPNPARDILFVKGNADILSLTGQKLREGTDTVDISTLESGMYLVRMGTKVTTFIKE